MKKTILTIFSIVCCLLSQRSHAQLITNYAGNGIWGFSGDGGPATSASLYIPIDVTTDLNGNVYIVDFNNNRIRKVNAVTGIITTVAGNGTSGYIGDGMAATASALHTPYGVAVDKNGNIYIADQQNNRIRKVDASTGLISTVAGSGTGGYAGDGGLATSSLCRLNNPDRVAVDTAGNIYITDQNRIRKVTASTGIISTYAGNGSYGYNGDGIAATSAQLAQPMGIAVNEAGDLFIADEGNNRLRKVDVSTGLISTLCGNGNGGYNGDGIPATSAFLNYPNSVAVDAVGNIFICDMNSNRIRKIDASTGKIYTVVGTGVQGTGGNGGPADSAQVSQPYSVAVDPCGNIFIGDGGDHVRKVTKIMGNMHFANPTCPGTPTGTAFVLPTGGVSPYTYAWTNGSTIFAAFNLYAGTYSVLITDNKGCITTETVTITDPPPPATPNICMVTVDDSSKNNVIYWDKTGYTKIHSFKIYRDTANNNYIQIGSVKFDSLSMFVDTARTAGAVNGDPNITTYRYKITALDSCGAMSAMSPYHNTVYSFNAGSQFIFNSYEIEGQPSPIPGLSGYVLKRDNYNTGSYVSVGFGSASSSIINDPSYNTYATTANWIVETQWNITCTPTLRQNNGAQTTIVRSKSNITNNRSIGINSLNRKTSVSIYPNPATDLVMIVSSANAENCVVEIYSSLGQKVSGTVLKNEVSQVDISGLERGVYEVRIISNAVVVGQSKIVKQ